MCRSFPCCRWKSLTWIGLSRMTQKRKMKKGGGTNFRQLAIGVCHYGKRHGEKNPEHCLALFCYMDAVGEAHRVYGGSAWLLYDEQFRQRRVVRPSLQWDHKDISLWMRLMSSARALNQSFSGRASGSASAGQPAGKKWGLFWQYNEGFCKFGGS